MIVLVGMDAAEHTLVERWMDEGLLPNLARLRSRGAWGTLDSIAEVLSASVWPGFTTGWDPERLGISNYMLWNPATLTMDRVSAEHLGVAPFWRRGEDRGPRTLALEVPYVYPVDKTNGLELHGWAAHYGIVPRFSVPPSWAGALEREFGKPPLDGYAPGHLSVRTYIRLRDKLMEATRRMTHLATTLMERERWDLVVMTLAATHSGGHQLWDATNVRGRVSEESRRELSDALLRLYQESDRGIGKIVEAAGPDATCMIFSLHGMGDQASLGPILPEMLQRILSGGAPAEAADGGESWMARLRWAVPNEWRSAVKRRLPMGLQHRISLAWKGTGREDWSSTRAFCLPEDREGFIQVNLKGREAHGIVDPGEPYDELCREIREGLGTFVDSDTGAPVIRKVETSWELFPNMKPEIRLRVPDLIIRWCDQASARIRSVSSPRYGDVVWPRPGVVMDGQSGHHRGPGWLLAVGPRVKPGGAIDSASTLDLPPTALALLGRKIPGDLAGRPIASLVSS